MREDIKSAILQYASARGLLCGICAAAGALCDRPPCARPPAPPFVRYTAEERFDPSLALNTAKSVIVLGRPYPRISSDDSILDAGVPRGRISAGAVGVDYHRALKDELERLVLFLRELAGEFDYRIMVDTGPLCEREFARAAGVGWYGKNCCLYSPAYGSFFNIGLAVTSLELPPTPAYPPDYSECGGCDICARACPGGAIAANGFSVDWRRCSSYLTQKKEDLSDEEKHIIGNRVYGCDICQNVCPKNARAPVLSDRRAMERAAPDLNELKDITNSAFKARFSQTALYWRGAAVIRRNAGIALDNLGNCLTLE